jgi:hypothetical protein
MTSLSDNFPLPNFGPTCDLPDQAPQTLKKYIDDTGKKVPENEEFKMNIKPVMEIINRLSDDFGFIPNDVCIQFGDRYVDPLVSINCDQDDSFSGPGNDDYELCIANTINCMMKPFVGDGGISVPTTYAVTHPAWSEFMNNYAVWIDRGSDNRSGQTTNIYWQVNIKKSDTYTFNISADNNAVFTINSDSLGTTTSFTQTTTVTKSLQPGVYKIKAAVFNESGSGQVWATNPVGVALSISDSSSNSIFSTRDGTSDTGWKPQAANCQSFVAKGFGFDKKVKDKICAANCIPKDQDGKDVTRLGIYELVYDNNNSVDYYYTNNPNDVPSGYVRTKTTPSFYVLGGNVTKSTELYKYYSSTAFDTFLCTRPGPPYTSAPGESASIAAAGQQYQSVIGYVFEKEVDGENYLCEDENLVPLHRYYKHVNSPSTLCDHKYSIQGFNSVRLKYEKNKFIYQLPPKIDGDLTITYDMIRGSAGKKCSWGYYLATSSRVPAIGQVIQKNATDNNSAGQITIPKATLTSYAGGYLGFFLGPGTATLSTLVNNDMLTFSTNGLGYQAYKSGSLVPAKAGVPGNSMGGNNYFFFSDHTMNPVEYKQYGEVDYCRFYDEYYQGWEDWSAGDADYDDVKVKYELEWTSNGYRYEGVQCYVYEQPAKPPIYISAEVIDYCDPDRILKYPVQDVFIKRGQCGGSDGEVSCGDCIGTYLEKKNNIQVLEIVKSGVIKLMSFGGQLTGDGSCTKFGLKVSKNDTVILNTNYTASRFPRMGEALTDAILVSAGDNVTLEFTEIYAGHPNAFVIPEFSVYNVGKDIHECLFKCTLATKSVVYDLANKLPKDFQLIGTEYGQRGEGTYSASHPRYGYVDAWNYSTQTPTNTQLSTEQGNRCFPNFTNIKDGDTFDEVYELNSNNSEYSGKGCKIKMRITAVKDGGEYDCKWKLLSIESPGTGAYQQDQEFLIEFPQKGKHSRLKKTINAKDRIKIIVKITKVD